MESLFWGQVLHRNIFLVGKLVKEWNPDMPRALRHQYPGAVYHVMARGDGGKAVFEGDDDRKAFLFRLGQVCGSHGWRVHAWVLMGNHFHLLLETPEPNLVTEFSKPGFLKMVLKHGQWENTLRYDRKKRRVILNGVECELIRLIRAPTSLTDA